jgi:putative ABC transport system permease protein
VLWTVLREGVGLIVLGLAIGLPAVKFTARGLSALLYGVEPSGAGMVLTSAAILSGVAILAGLFPALRAARVNPLLALRHE